MTIRSFQAKLLTLLVMVLVLLQAATLIAVRLAGQRTLRRNITDELRVGSRVFDQTLAARGRQLSDTVRVLASDFAFREAIASGDQPTITSVLSNHGSRIAADAALLISLDGAIIADTLGGRLVGERFALSSLVEKAVRRGEASAIASFGFVPHQLVIVPVLGPRPIAWVCMGFAIDAEVLREVSRLAALDVSLTTAGASPHLVSTLPAEWSGELLEQTRMLSPLTGDVERMVELDSEEWMTLLHPLRTADDSPLNALLHRSVADARRPQNRLEFQIFGLSSVALFFALIGAVFFARGVSLPLQRLAEGAQRIERGDYSTPVEIRQDDEIGQLAHAFERMRSGIAEREEQIRHQATHDGLTGLPNRTLFLDRLSHAIARAKRSGEYVGMIMMDLDRFKDINDTLGHQFGDELLNEIGRRLSQTLRESDTVARLGGDEFVVTFYARDPSRAVDIARRIQDALESPFILGGVSMALSGSMGIALCPTHAEDAGTLMKRADVAMYDAKRSHAAFAVYEPGRDEHSLRRLSILSELRPAVANEELEVHYQPKIDAGTDRIIHAEALVRWRHPQYGVLGPDEFIPLAEQSGNIGIITKWVLRKAIADCAGWNESGHDLAVAVNLSALDLFDPELPTLISGLLSEAGLPASKLLLEITESAIMNDPAHALKILSDLKVRGIALAIDDYGTGYSSLAHLKRFPVDELKIDKSFVLNLHEGSSDDFVIVRSTIELGHNMGLRVIAEGVENAEAWRILKALGCDMAQGYFFSPPLPLAEFRTWIDRA